MPSAGFRLPLLSHFQKIEDNATSSAGLGWKQHQRDPVRKRNAPGQTEITGHFHILPRPLQLPFRPQGWTQMPRHHSRGVGVGALPLLAAAAAASSLFPESKACQDFCLVLCVPYPRTSLDCLSILPSHPTSSCSVLLRLWDPAASVLHPTLSTAGCESFWGHLSSLGQ